ncbi:MAG: DUF362 domain-containing protein [candidate division KSB1 bacterium]|nr:DUF362 domain-containing protein [candidate division KSB1 bacterium]
MLLSRRSFLEHAAACCWLFGGAPLSGAGKTAQAALMTAAAVRNGEPAQLVAAAIEALGGMSRFVSKGDRVLLKPNIGWDRIPEQGATTNPQLVASVVRLCLEAGAKSVKVADRPCNNALRCYRRSGIETAVKKEGAEVRFLNDASLVMTPFPQGRAVKEWPIYREAYECDVLINLPIAKVHSMSGVTLGMKNLMGLLGGDRGLFHVDFAEKIVDLCFVLRPTLTIIDGWRVLLRNGPTGGSPDDTALRRTVIASTDIVAADALGAELLGFSPNDVPHIRRAYERGLGEMNRQNIVLKEIDLGQ